jgi:hypothetical protein
VVSEATKDVCEVAREEEAGEDEHRTARQESVTALAGNLCAQLVDLDLAHPTIENSKRPSITKILRACLAQHFSSDDWQEKDARTWTVTGEVNYPVSETMQDELLYGSADAIMNQDGKPYCVIQQAVDNNGREEKFEQGRDFCSILGQIHDIPVLLLVMIHVGRKPDTYNGVVKVVDNFSVDVFLVLVKHANGDACGKSAFLWREHFPSENTANLEKGRTTVRKDWLAVTRAVYDAKFLADLTQNDCSSIRLLNWHPLGDNCARSIVPKTDTDDGYCYVYKIFDNRYSQTYRSPDLWLAKDQNKPGECAPWLKKLNVENILEVEEPHAPELNNEYTLGTVNSGPVPYGFGRVLVLGYLYIEGAHVPKSVYSFVSVAKQLQEMYDGGYVHGDIRAYNMVFGQTQNDADKAWLIDFDFSGKENGKCYPPGYSRSRGTESWETNQATEEEGRLDRSPRSDATVLCTRDQRRVATVQTTGQHRGRGDRKTICMAQSDQSIRRRTCRCNAYY